MPAPDPRPTTNAVEAAEKQPAPSDAGFGGLRARSQDALDRIYAFRFIYVAVFVFIVLYVFSVRGAERLLQDHFSEVVRDAVRITNLDTPVKSQIQARIDQGVARSPWVRWGGVQAHVIVLASDGATWIYVAGRTTQPTDVDAAEIAREAARLLPAQEEVIVSVPHNALLANAILVFYASGLLIALFLYNRAIGRGEAERLRDAVAARDLTVLRAASIEQELEAVRRKMLEVEPAEREQSEEIRGLQRERRALQTKLSALAQREEDLRLKAARATELDQERQALEELLEEAGSDLSSKQEEIRRLETTLKRSGGKGGSQKASSRESELLARRFETLYKTLEIDSRAIDDIVRLKDETMKLKAEESLKRLADEIENVAVRRKVGGLPPSHAVFELGFAGKGRIYYTKGVTRRFRILTVGAKNTQKTDLEYLRRLPL